MYLLDYFTQGNIPDSLIGVPENWTPDQIASYQKYWDAYFDGDLGRRRRAKFVPGGVARTFIQTKEPDLKGPFDEWLARIVCFAFSISPQAQEAILTSYATKGIITINEARAALGDRRTIALTLSECKVDVRTPTPS